MDNYLESDAYIKLMDWLSKVNPGEYWIIQGFNYSEDRLHYIEANYPDWYDEMIS